MASPSKIVLAVGELLWDMLPEEKLLGGAPANFCHRLCQLGVDARMVSRVGADKLGDELFSALSALQFDLSLIQRDHYHPTGTVDVTLSSHGDPTFVINTDVAYDYLELRSDLSTAAARADLICFGTLAQRSEKTRNTLLEVLDGAPQALKLLDINLRRNCFTPAIIEDSLRRTDILKLNTAEVATISDIFSIPSSSHEEFASRLIERFGIKTVLVTRGANGVYARSSNEESCEVAGVSVSLVDTIGSGDSFTAGFVYKLLRSAPLEECCYFGNLIGALNATKKGGMPNISPAELSAFVAQHSA